MAEMRVKQPKDETTFSHTMNRRKEHGNRI